MLQIVLIASFITLYGISIRTDLILRNRTAGLYLSAGVCCILTIATALRDISGWPDTKAYVGEFGIIPPLTAFTFDNAITLYHTDKGFQLLSSAIKTITDDYVIYFLIIGAITFFLLYKSLRRYSVLPAVGLAVYVSRFMIGRDMMQIRQALSIILIIFATRHITRRELLPFMLILAVAVSIHVSALIALPIYWFARWRMNRGTIIGLVLLSAGISLMLPSVIPHIAGTIHRIFGAKECYFMLGPWGWKYVGKGLLNPMIYYQLILLALFIIKEKDIGPTSTDYLTVRNGYLYSTLLLMAFSPLAVIAGRLSTIFATYEICIIPALLASQFRNQLRQRMAIAATGIVLLGIFYKNIASANVW